MQNMKKKMMTAMLCIAFSAVAPAQTVQNLSVDEMFRMIEKSSKSMQQQKTGIAAAQEGVKVAKSKRLPDINAQLSASYISNAVIFDRDFSHFQNAYTPHFGNSFVLDVQQTIYAGGAIDAGIQLAELGAKQAGLGADLTRQNLRFMAVAQYLDLQKLTNREQVIKSNIALTQQLIDQINDKHAQGVALKNDVTRYELQMQTLKLTLIQLQNQRSILNHQLCNTLGLDTDTTIQPTDDTAKSQFGREGETQWQQHAEDGSQQLQMAGINEQMARQQEKLVKSELLPKVALVANNSLNGPITFELPPINQNFNVWYVGVGVQYSLSSLFKSNKKVKQARLAAREAQEATAVAREQVNNQVQSAYTNYLQSYEELSTQTKKVQLAQENYQVVNDRYLNQLALITDMLDASNMKLDAELSEVDARINIAYAYYKMKFIAGQL
jgi:outer membrane protein